MKNFSDRIREFQGEPVYEILAYTNESKDWFVVWREWVNGKKLCRNLEYLPVYGYKAYGKPEKHFFKPLCNTPKIMACTEYPATDFDLEPILRKYPNFKYTAAKYGSMQVKELFNILRIWLKTPEMEILLNFKLKNLAINRTFLKMPRSRQKAIVDFAIKNDGTSACLVDITGAMKFGCTIEDYRFFRQQCTHCAYKVTFDEFRSINGKGIHIYDFAMHKRHLAEYFPERVNDPYWMKFKDAKEFHRKERKVNRQIEAKKAFEKAEELRKIQEAYTKAIKKFKDWSGTFDGYEIFVPVNVQEFQKQGDVLKQCLVWNNYAKQVSEKKCLLVFMQKKGKPQATVELTPKSHEIEQFRRENNKDATPRQIKAFEAFRQKFIAA